VLDRQSNLHSAKDVDRGGRNTQLQSKIKPAAAIPINRQKVSNQV